MEAPGLNARHSLPLLLLKRCVTGTFHASCPLFSFPYVQQLVLLLNLCACYAFSPCGLQICICTTTSAGPEQTLPWLYYHRTIGVEMFIVFVEGKAALPENAAALESIPVSLLLLSLLLSLLRLLLLMLY